jgi:hypothetical protein
MLKAKITALTIFLGLFLITGTNWTWEAQARTIEYVEEEDPFTEDEIREEKRPRLPKSDSDPSPKRQKTTSEREESSVAYNVAMYLPNRLFDLLDIVRCRAKVGPGAALGLRATEFLEAYLGSQVSLGLGLPGPRLEPKFPLPIGIESRNGFKLSVIDGTIYNSYEPVYSTSEIGLSLHLLAVGAEVTVDPVEIIDFLGGILTLDIREDDL